MSAIGPVEDPVLTHAVDSVLVISINRPQARNAINADVARAIAAALDGFDAADHLAVTVLTGVGGTFCAGMDLKAFLAGEYPAAPGRGFAGIAERSAEKPLIAAVQGHAVAGGFEIALACDLNRRRPRTHTSACQRLNAAWFPALAGWCDSHNGSPAPSRWSSR